jgi:hypothetical protein
MMDARVCGIPCQVEVIEARYIRPQSSNPYGCSSDLDYYGYWEDVDYELYDRRGYRAKWLENKMTPKDHTDLFNFIIENLEPEDY